mmetsp:Transcript_125487/g.216854  ORF Transcript_125487/g.216854 Transcript_125487/m.216854 type:complete len:155 (+) Transcript_125487:1034-1498(+)
MIIVWSPLSCCSAGAGASWTIGTGAGSWTFGTTARQGAGAGSWTFGTTAPARVRSSAGAGSWTFGTTARQGAGAGAVERWRLEERLDSRLQVRLLRTRFAAVQFVVPLVGAPVASCGFSAMPLRMPLRRMLPIMAQDLQVWRLWGADCQKQVKD